MNKCAAGNGTAPEPFGLLVWPPVSRIFAGFHADQGFAVTGDQARKLKAGDYVCWRGVSEGELGVVTKAGRFGVVIRWADGHETSPLFNDMKRISQTDADGRIIHE